MIRFLLLQRDQALYKDAVIGPLSEFQFIKGSDIVKLELTGRETTGWNATYYRDSQQVLCY